MFPTAEQKPQLQNNINYPGWIRTYYVSGL